MEKRLSTGEIERMKSELAELPVGCVSCKTIKGVKRYYRQWIEAGRTRSEYLPADRVAKVRTQIARRRELTKALKPYLTAVGVGKGEVVAGVKTGEGLLRWASAVKGWKARTILPDIMKFLRWRTEGRVCLVYGIRRTGKTTLLQQSVLEMTADERAHAAYFKVRDGETLDEVARKLDALEAAGVRYVLIDEVTLAADFIDGASLFSDVYAMSGMKIVLSGTDSLGFWMSINQELFDRAYLFHTSFVPFREYSRLLAIDDVDEYIRYGGLLKRGHADFDDPRANEPDASFRDEESTRLYIDTAIARNIQHSLASCRDGRYFRHLRELYEADELTNAINRVIEDMNREFLVSVITRDFRSSDLGIAGNALRAERNPARRRIVSSVMDVKAVTAELMRYLDIRNADRQTVAVTAEHVAEIREYLEKLDLVVSCPVRHISRGRELSATEQALFAQPGMRYCQAEALVKSMLKDVKFSRADPAERTFISDRILENVRGRMLEEIVLLETMAANPNPRDIFEGREVFKLMFESGEFDMVVRDLKSGTCEICEIKHSKEPVDEQFRHLVDTGKCAQVERLFGRISSRKVYYRGPDFLHPGGVEYLNVEKYLKNL